MKVSEWIVDFEKCEIMHVVFVEVCVDNGAENGIYLPLMFLFVVCLYVFEGRI